jgi:hypothetical protein
MGPAMAKSGDIKEPKQTLREMSAKERFEKSAEGQELDVVVDHILNGDHEKFQKSYNEYRKKYGLDEPPPITDKNSGY